MVRSIAMVHVMVLACWMLQIVLTAAGLLCCLKGHDVHCCKFVWIVQVHDLVWVHLVQWLAEHGVMVSSL